jgi:hypothetical protein
MAYPYDTPRGLRPATQRSWSPQVEEPSEFTKALLRGFRSLPEDARRVQPLASAATGATDLELDAQLAERTAAEEAAYDPHLAPRVQSYRDIRTDAGVGAFFEDAGDYAASMAGEQAPLLGGMAFGAGVGGLVAKGVGALAGAALPYLSATNAQMQRQITQDPDASGTTREQILGAGGIASGQTALGLLPFGAGANALRASGSRLSRGAKAAGVAGSTEALTEVGEEVLGNVGHRQLFNPEWGVTDDAAMEQYGNAALGGLLLGGPTGFAAGVLAPKNLTKSAQNAIQTGVEDGLSPEQALDSYVETNLGILDDGEIQGLRDALPGFQPATTRGRLQRKMDALEAKEELDIAYSNVLGMSEEEYRQFEKGEFDRAVRRQQDAEANRQAVPLNEATLTDVALDVLEGRLSPTSTEVHRVMQHVGRRRFLAKVASVWKMTQEQGQKQEQVAPGALVAEDPFQLEAQKERESFEEDDYNALASSLRPDAVQEQNNYEVQESEKPETIYNFQGLPWTDDKTSAVNAARKKAFEYQDIENQEELARIGPLEEGNSHIAEKLKNAPYKVVSLREALETEAEGKGYETPEQKSAYAYSRASDLLKTTEELSVNKETGVLRENLFNLSEKYKSSPDAYMDNSYVIRKDAMAPIVDPEANDILKNEQLDRKQDPSKRAARVDADAQIQNLTRELDQRLYGTGEDAAKAKLIMRKYDALKTPTDRHMFYQLPSHKAVIDRVQEASGFPEVSGIKAEIKRLKKEARNLEYAQRGTVRPSNKEPKDKRIKVVFRSTDGGKTATRMLDPMDASRKAVKDLPYDENAPRDVKMRRIVEGIASVLGSRTRDYSLFDNSIPYETIVYTEGEGESAKPIRWKDVVEHFAKGRTTWKKGSIDLKAVPKRKTGLDSDEWRDTSKPAKQGTGLESKTGEAQPLPKDESIMYEGRYPKDPGPYEFDLTWDEKREYGFEHSIEKMENRIDSLNSLLSEKSSKSRMEGRIGVLERSIDKLRKRWAELEKRKNTVLEAYRNKYKGEKKGELADDKAKQEALAKIASDAKAFDKVLSAEQKTVEGQAAILKKRIEELPEKEYIKADKDKLRAVLDTIKEELQRAKLLREYAESDLGQVWSAPTAAQNLRKSRIDMFSDALPTKLVSGNVADADATVLFTEPRAWKGKEARDTVELASKLGKPLIQLNPYWADAQRKLTNFLIEHRPKTLNLGGNKGKVSNEAKQRVRKLVHDILAGEGKAAQAKTPRPKASVSSPPYSKLESNAGPSKRGSGYTNTKKKAENTEGKKRITVAEDKFRDERNKKLKKSAEITGNYAAAKDATLSMSEIPSYSAESINSLREAYSEKRRTSQQKFADKMYERLGLKGAVRVMTLDESLKVAKRVGKDIASRRSHGFVWSDRENDTTNIYVNPRLSATAALEVLSHEIGHVVLDQTWRGASRKLKRAVKKAYGEWAKRMPQDPSLYDVVSRRTPQQLLENIVWSNINLDQKISSMPKEDQRYMLHFKEWFADNVAKWAVTDAKPRGLIDQFFKYIADTLRDLWSGVVRSINTPDQSVQDYMDAIFNSPDPVFFDNPADSFSYAENPEQAAGEQLGANWAVGITGGAEIYNAMRDGLKPEELNALGNAVQKPFVQRQLVKFYGGDPFAMSAIDNDDTMRMIPLAYGAWRAGELNLSNAQQGAMRSFVESLSKSLGVVGGGQQAEEVMRAVARGAARSVERPSFVRTRVNESVLQETRQYIEKLSAPILKTANKLAGTADMRVRASKNAAIMELWKQIYTAVDQVGGKEAFFSARNQQYGRWLTRMHDIFDGKDEALGAAVLRVLHKEVPLDRRTEEGKVAQQVYDMLQDMYEYALDAQVKLNNAGKEYFPRVYDHDYIDRHGGELVNMLTEKYHDELIEYGKKLQEENWETEPDPKEVAQRIQRALVKASGDQLTAEEDMVREAGDDPLGWPAAHHLKERGLGWIKDEDIAPFLSKELGLTMSTYIKQMVKRAEYNRRFGVGNRA